MRELGLTRRTAIGMLTSVGLQAQMRGSASLRGTARLNRDNLIAWYKPESLGAGGSNIALWPDSAGLGYDATASVANPTVQADSINGYKSAILSGSSQYFTLPSGVSSTPRTSSVFVVYARDINQSGVQAPVTLGTGNNFMPEFTGGGFSFEQVLWTGSATLSGLSTRTGFCLLGVTNTAGALTFFVDDRTIIKSVTVGGAGAVTGGWIGAFSGTQYVTARIAEIMIFNAAISGAQLASVRAYLLAKYGLGGTYANQCICFGDSITNGTGSTAFAANCYVDNLALSLGNNWIVKRQGVVSRTALTMITNGPTEVDGQYSAGIYSKNVCLVMAGANDMSGAGASAATTYSRVSQVCSDRRSAGWKVVASTLPENLNGGSAPAFNASMRSGYTGFADALLDWGADPAIGNVTPAYYIDGIHPNPAGHAILGSLAFAAISGL